MYMYMYIYIYIYMQYVYIYIYTYCIYIYIYILHIYIHIIIYVYTIHTHTMLLLVELGMNSPGSLPRQEGLVRVSFVEPLRRPSVAPMRTGRRSPGRRWSNVSVDFERQFLKRNPVEGIHQLSLSHYL